MSYVAGDADKIAEAYDSPSWWYDLRGFFILTLTYRSSLWSQIAFFSRNFSEQHLEVAIGSGTLLGFILTFRRLAFKPKAQITAFDYAPAMLAGAERRFRRHSNVRLSLGDASHMNYSDESFGSVNVANAIHCFSNVESALAEIHRVLKPGGRLAVNVLLYPRGWEPLRRIAERINRWGQKKGILHSPFHADQFIAQMQAAGFRILEQSITGNTLNLVAEKANARSQLGRASHA